MVVARCAEMVCSLQVITLSEVVSFESCAFGWDFEEEIRIAPSRSRKRRESAVMAPTCPTNVGVMDGTVKSIEKEDISACLAAGPEIA